MCVPVPFCIKCRHLNRASIRDDSATCKAFPQGIPDRFWIDMEKHLTSVPGDGGVTAELYPDSGEVIVGDQVLPKSIGQRRQPMATHLTPR